MLQGKTKIELFETRPGGGYFKVEDSNMVTNACYNLFNPSSTVQSLQDTPFNPRKIHNPILKRCFGGLLLFGNPLTEDKNLIMPGQNVNIGHAGLPYTGADPYIGTLNQTESKEINGGKGYRFVWDFATDKANGTIRSVALTSATGGMTGYSKKDNTGTNKTFLCRVSSPLDGSGTDSPMEVVQTEYSSFCMVGCFSKDTFLYANAADGANRVQFRTVESLQLCTLKTNYPKLTKEKTVTSTKKLTFSSGFHQVGSKLYSVYPYETNKIDIVVFNGLTLEIESEQTLIVQDAQFTTTFDRNTPRKALYKNGFLYVQHSDKKQVYKINELDTSDYSIIITSASTLEPLCFLGEYIWIPCNGTGINRLYDGENVSEVNTYMLDPRSSSVNSPFINLPYLVLSKAYHNTPYGRYENIISLGIFTPFLSTINNLSTPVVKNETQTMKVTYEITEI